MIVLHDFTPCVDDELEVKRGQMVSVLYIDNDWVYVIAEDNSEGFIPHSYCTPLTSQLADLVKHKKLPRTTANGTSAGDSDQGRDMDNYSAAASDIHPFFKDPLGRYVVLYTFIARDENDVTVERGEFVTVLNKEDPDWFWIIRSNSEEGFVPASFLCSIEIAIGKVPNATNNAIANGNGPTNQQANYPSGTTMIGQTNGHIEESTTTYSNSANSGKTSQGQPFYSSTDSSGLHGSKMVVLYDYEAQAADELDVVRGEIIVADLRHQESDEWLWVYSPKKDKCGFIPQSFTRPRTTTTC